jgi:prepilin-type N-terminal cleavage/methylation domain-containing protein/prepilin-type processing-associated H-X9-DG protein
MKLGNLHYPTKRTRAFTLLEMLIGLVIIAVLASVLLSAIGGMREKARETTCAGNMRSIGQAMALYLTDHQGLQSSPGVWPGGGGFWWREWAYAYGPYLKANYDPLRDWDLKVFWCPSFKPTGANNGPKGPPDAPEWQMMNTSYWIGDAAAGDQSVDPPIPHPRDYLNKHNILREQGFFHDGGNSMNILFGDGHVENRRWSDPTQWPPP